jgi:solute carrier family 25 (mitochondrial carnitine/acylcarnitine transporter), member 20/29
MFLQFYCLSSPLEVIVKPADNDEMKVKNRILNFLFEFLLRRTGCAGLLVGHPFDTVKVHLQTQDYKNPLYRGTYDCLKKIIQKESVRGLYRGISSPLASISVLNAIVFGVYGNVQRKTSDPDSLFAHFCAGSAAGLSQTFICSPMELVKTRLQIQNNHKTSIKHDGPVACLKHIWRHEGHRGVFKGLGITAFRDVPGKLRVYMKCN